MFPGPAKTDALDTHRMLELLRMHAQVPLAKGILQEVGAVPPANAQLKRLTRRRRQLVAEKVRVVNRMQADLHAVCPGLVAIAASVDSRWFLGLLSCRSDLSRIAKLRLTQPEVSHLMNGHYSRFTTDKPLDFLKRLDRKVIIQISPHRRAEPYQQVALSL